jgi:galactoside O-acetyltransferase
MGVLARIKNYLFVSVRIWKYKILSDCGNTSGAYNCYQPVLLKGKGVIKFGKNVQFGVTASPNFYSHYAYLEVRHAESSILIGDNVSINNAFSAIAFSKISIGNDVLIGVNCSIIDTDAHEIDPERRMGRNPNTASVMIDDNVFIGSNVTVLKGIRIGRNSVIGNGSIVTKDIPDNVIAAGNPARIIRTL